MNDLKIERYKTVIKSQNKIKTQTNGHDSKNVRLYIPTENDTKYLRVIHVYIYYIAHNNITQIRPILILIIVSVVLYSDSRFFVFDSNNFRIIFLSFYVGKNKSKIIFIFNSLSWCCILSSILSCCSRIHNYLFIGQIHMTLPN